MFILLILITLIIVSINDKTKWFFNLNNNIMNYYTYLILSMIFNSILLFCLLSPNIVYFIHHQYFNWKSKPKQ